MDAPRVPADRRSPLRLLVGGVDLPCLPSERRTVHHRLPRRDGDVGLPPGRDQGSRSGLAAVPRHPQRPLRVVYDPLFLSWRPDRRRPPGPAWHRHGRRGRRLDARDGGRLRHLPLLPRQRRGHLLRPDRGVPAPLRGIPQVRQADRRRRVRPRLDDLVGTFNGGVLFCRRQDGIGAGGFLDAFGNFIQTGPPASGRAGPTSSGRGAGGCSSTTRPAARASAAS
jgi:hypothetical protein